MPDGKLGSLGRKRHKLMAASPSGAYSPLSPASCRLDTECRAETEVGTEELKTVPTE